MDNSIELNIMKERVKLQREIQLLEKKKLLILEKLRNEKNDCNHSIVLNVGEMNHRLGMTYVCPFCMATNNNFFHQNKFSKQNIIDIAKTENSTELDEENNNYHVANVINDFILENQDGFATLESMKKYIEENYIDIIKKYDDPKLLLKD